MNITPVSLIVRRRIRRFMMEGGGGKDNSHGCSPFRDGTCKYEDNMGPVIIIKKKNMKRLKKVVSQASKKRLFQCSLPGQRVHDERAEGGEGPCWT